VKHLVQLPGVSKRVEVTEPGALSGMRVEVDGEALPRKGWLRPVYAVPTDGGGSMDVEVRFDAFRGGLQLKGPEFSVRAGEPIPTALAVLAFLPFALAGVGGAIGGAMGAIGWLANRQVAAQRWPLPARIVLMLAITVVAALAWLVAATAIATLL
jgi:hypothetical protein